MNKDLLLSVRALRNQISHGGRIDAGSLAKQLQELGVSVPVSDLQRFLADLLRGLGSEVGEHFTPPLVLDVVSSLLQGRAASIACDPCAGLGVLAARVHDDIHAGKTIACAPNEGSLALGRVLAPQLEWHTAGPLAFLEKMTAPLDVVASILPFGIRVPQAVGLKAVSGETVRRTGELGPIVLAAASLHLSAEGIGLFVVTPSFFFTERSILHDLPRLGLGIEAALALPAGTFAPYANIRTFLVIVRKHAFAKMFVAQLSQDIHANSQIMQNLRAGKGDGELDLGRFVDPAGFRGLEPLRLAEQYRHAEHRLQMPAVSLAELTRVIHVGRSGDEFKFPKAQNALYIPLIGVSDVVDSIEEMAIKPQNYAQVVVDSSRSDARFVAHFLNSDLGRATREANQTGTSIQKLNTTGIKELRVFVPNAETQKKILEIEARLEAKQNTLLGLQNDLETMRRELWSSPDRLDEVDSRLRAFSGRLAADAAPQGGVTMEQWFETLPFPIASILRAWQATPSQDYEKKYQHLLHFFEAAAEFVSVIYLSAFSSNAEFFSGHRSTLMAAWKKQNLSLERATFGTWKVVVEYLGKQTRNLLSADTEKRTLCAEIFADPTLALPQMLARTELATVLSTGNKMRNDWTGHGGVVGDAEARLRNEKLLSEVQELRKIMADGWDRVQMIQCLHCKPRRGKFENEVAVLVGSNSEFLKETRSMSSWLDVERLYLTSRQTDRSLLLLPLMHVGPSPASAKNACYFFNRVEKDGVRFVSYHFVDQPERKEKFDDATAAISFLTQTELGAS